MAWCKRCALKRQKGEKEKKKREKKRKKGKMGIVFSKSVRMFFFHMRCGHFSNIYRKLYLDLVDHIRYCLRSTF